jgi:hypothetical protein
MKLDGFSNERLTIPEIIALIQPHTSEKVTSANWLSHAQLIAKQYKISLPSIGDVTEELRQQTEAISLARRSYHKVSASDYAQQTELKNLLKQLQDL